MSIWNKILVGLIGVASLALFYMAARTLKTHQHWRELALEHERKIAQVRGEGEQTQVGIRQLRLELNKLLLDRRRAWFKCDPKVQVNPEDRTAVIAVVTDQPDPSGIAENTILYAFEEADVRKQGRYLGEFKVTKTDEKQKQVVLAPTSLLRAREIDRLETAKRPWTLYEIMPRDNHDIDRKKDVRPLRDYQVLLSSNRVRSTLLADQIDATTGDQKLVVDALAQAKQQEAAAKQELAAAKEDVDKFTRERNVVDTYRKMLERELGVVKAAADRLIETNEKLAGKIAKLQLEAARRIDERTRAMAQSGAGG